MSLSYEAQCKPSVQKIEPNKQSSADSAASMTPELPGSFLGIEYNGRHAKDLLELFKEAHVKDPDKWKVVTVKEFLALTVPASRSDVRAGYVDADPIGSRYLYDYNDITNLHAMQTGECFREYGDTYEQPNNLWVYEKTRRFRDDHMQGPDMTAHGCMQCVCHLKWPIDVEEAVSLHKEASSSRMMSVDLFVVDYRDELDPSMNQCHFAQKVSSEGHRPFKCVVKVRLYDVWRKTVPQRQTLKQDLRFVMHEAACTPLTMLARVFVDIDAPKATQYVRQRERMFSSLGRLGYSIPENPQSWTLPGSFVQGCYVLPLLLPYVFQWRCAKESTPLIRGLTPWFLRPLLGTLVHEVAPFVLPSIHNKAALHQSLHRRSLTPGEDMRFGLLLSPLPHVKDESLGFSLASTGYMAKRGVRANQQPVSCRRVSWSEVRKGTNMMDAAWYGEEYEWQNPDSDSDSEDMSDGFQEVKEGVRAAWSHPQLGAALDAVLRELRGTRRHPVLLALTSIRRQRWISLEGSDDVELQQALFQSSVLLGSDILVRIMRFL